MYVCTVLVYSTKSRSRSREVEGRGWVDHQSFFLHIEKQDEESGKESGVLSEEGNEV